MNRSALTEKALVQEGVRDYEDEKQWPLVREAEFERRALKSQYFRDFLEVLLRDSFDFKGLRHNRLKLRMAIFYQKKLDIILDAIHLITVRPDIKIPDFVNWFEARLQGFPEEFSRVFWLTRAR